MASVGLRSSSSYTVTPTLLIKNTAARYQPLPFVDQPQRHSIVRCCIGPTLVLTAAAAAAVPTAFRQPDLLCTLYDILMSHPSPIRVAVADTTCATCVYIRRRSPRCPSVPILFPSISHFTLLPQGRPPSQRRGNKNVVKNSDFWTYAFT